MAKNNLVLLQRELVNAQRDIEKINKRILLASTLTERDAMLHELYKCRVEIQRLENEIVLERERMAQEENKPKPEPLASKENEKQAEEE